MRDEVFRQQQALRAGIQNSDERAKQSSREIAMGVLRQYHLVLGFLERIEPTLANYPELNVFYFPIQSEQLLCVYRTKDRPQPIPVELPQPKHISVEYRPYQADTRLRAQQLFDRALNEPLHILSDRHPPLDIRGHSGDYRHSIINLMLAALDGYLPRPYPKNTSSLAICCSIPEQIIQASGPNSRLRDLIGILILFGDEQSFSQECHQKLAEELSKEFNQYFAEVGHYAIPELEFFISSLLNQEERLEDNQNRALGFIAHMVAHRFRSLREAAQHIAEEFPTAESISRDPQSYEKQVRLMRSQLDRGQALEKQLEYIGQSSPMRSPLLVRHVLGILDQVLNEMKKHMGSSVQSEIEVSYDIRKEYVVIPPQSILGEVFSNHLENMLRTIDQPNVDDKRLVVRVYPEAGYVCFAITNYGPALSTDVKEDLQRTVRVRRPSGSGLGMFLSGMIMRHVGGDQEVESPIQDNIGVRVTLKFPRP